tara:strand:- start:335 stop:1093 length:759 start_codon:yes stop_codon:yes gene_type:complete
MYDCFQHHRATEPFPNWVIRDCRLSFKKFVKSVVTNSKVVYSDLNHFNEYKDKTVLVIGAGPSTNNVNFNEIERDFTWSCNHFYLNSKLREMKIDLAMLMSEPDLESKEFLEYRKKYEPYLGFEIHDRWFEYEFDDYDKYFVMHPKFYGRIGIGARMLIFAAALECKKVKFVGFDGPEYQIKGDHAFEPGKTTLPSVCNGKTHEQIISIHKIQYDLLWGYIKDNFPNSELVNIGFESIYHELLKQGENNESV